MIPADKLPLAHTFAEAAPAAEQLFTTATLDPNGLRWFPKLAGALVRPTGMPQDGYISRADAIAGASQYREACAAALASAPIEGQNLA